MPVTSAKAKLAAAKKWLARFPLRSWMSDAADMLFPPACVLCGEEMEQAADEVLICDRCRTEAIDGREPCPCCGAGLPEGVSPQERCPHCRRERFKFSSVVRLGDYEGPLRPAILRAKQSINVAIAIHLGRLMVKTRHQALLGLEADAVVAVPAYWTRRTQHGHNSAEAIAMEVAKGLGLPLAINVLVRTRATARQTQLTPPQRKKNVSGAFAVHRHPDLPGAKLLLVDDVLTTGSTANEASKALLKAGAAWVSIAVLARAVG